jgi:DNA-binding SARP family transcriptional activator
MTVDTAIALRHEASTPAQQERPEPPAPAVPRLCLLDGFAVECGNDAIELPLSAQRLVAFLAFQERPVLRTYVAGSLWLEKSEDRANANLRAALWRLRQPGLQLVDAAGNHLALSRGVAVDVRDAFLRARQLLAGTRVDLDAAALDALLLSGEILPDWYEDWVVIERERLRQLRLHALEALCARLVEQGDLAQAIDVGLAAVAAEPLRESVHRVLIRAHLAEGNKAEALRQYDAYAALLWDELGVRPSYQLLDLIDTVRDPIGGAR